MAQLRSIPSEQVLRRLAIHYKADPTYRPVKDASSRRWQVCTARGEFEIVTRGACKWFDTRAGKGGGGAIDLTMHLLQLPFLEAVRLLGEEPSAAKPVPPPDPPEELLASYRGAEQSEENSGKIQEET